MRNHRSLMSGLGLGLIIGAMLLQMMNAIASPAPKTPSPTEQEMTPQELKSSASKYYQVFEKDEKVFTQPQVDGLVQQRLAEELAKAPAAAAPTATRETYVYVSKGMVAMQVADMLYQSGIITDRKAFEDQMNTQQLTGKIVPGIHVFKGPAPMELGQVIANITTP
jgi:hypothetical protein